MFTSSLQPKYDSVIVVQEVEHIRFTPFLFHLLTSFSHYWLVLVFSKWNHLPHILFAFHNFQPSCPSIHQSIFSRLSAHLSKHRSPDLSFSLPSLAFSSSFAGETPRHPRPAERYKLSSMSWIWPGPPLARTCPEHFTQEASCQMPEPP